MKSTEKAVSAKKHLLARGGAVSVSRSSLSKLRRVFRCLSVMSAAVCFSMSLASLPDSAITAEAVNPTKFLTVQETRALYGDTISAQVYYDGSYHNVTFQYLDNHTTTPAGLNQIVPSGTSSFGNWPSVEYVCFDVGNVTTSQDTVTVYLHPEYSVFNTENFSTFVALSTEQDIPSSVYDSSAWDFSGTLGAQTFYSPISYENGVSNGMYSTSQMFTESYPHDNKVIPIPVDIQETHTFTISSIECRFRGCSPWWDYNNNRMYLYIGCPRVDDVSSYSSGTVTETTAATGGGGDVNNNITVIVNNQEVVSALDEQNAQNSEYQDKMINGDPQEATTVASMDSGVQSGIEAALDGEDLENAIYTDIPNAIAAAGFWVAILGKILQIIPIIKVVFAPAILLSLLAYILWRK